jgi:hypothetical protein
MNKGTCLLTYIPVRKEPGSGTEMTTSLIFGESYTILETANEWLRIRNDFDGYEGWIHSNAFSDHQEFSIVCDSLFLEAMGRHQKLYIPCGANIPDSGIIQTESEKYTLEKKLKTNHHLPLPLRLAKTAQSFLNTPYLWGGRTFMGIDCSGFTQVVFKSCGITLPRDSKDQAGAGEPVEYRYIKACDLVLFSRPDSEKITHVGMMLDQHKIIHASGKVKINELEPEGMYINGEQLTYKTRAIRRMI